VLLPLLPMRPTERQEISMTIIRGALRRFDRWTLRTFNPMPTPFGLGPMR
jgi:hypothetical protein